MPDPAEYRTTPEEILLRLDAIMVEAEKGDHESAHALEDGLYRYVLEQIKDISGDTWAQRMATLALKATNIKFERWCA